MGMLQGTFKSALLTNRDKLIKESRVGKVGGNPSLQPVTLSMKYSRQFNKIKGIINRYLPVLHADRELREYLILVTVLWQGGILAPSIHMGD
ncbi:hypothetical protein XELAEV_18046956mg [Xenopus laevis]|uniref:Uncharacterized protein n=1 Tax=Xenopus laevis TaxID=8355 RepID=A0A974H1F5_XENLA|nr:hypothetical protein XELAEV_18046956mg [Xenopus laevis]